MWWNLRVMMIWLPRSWKRKYASKSNLLKEKYKWFFEYLALSFSLKACDIWSGVFSLILGFPWRSVGKASACNAGSSIQFSSVAQSCPTFCDPMNPNTPGLPVHHQLPEFIQTHVHRVSDAIQPSHSLLSPSPPDLNPSQNQGLFQGISSSHQVLKLLEFQLQHQSFQWTSGLISFRMDWLDLLAVQGTLESLLQHHSSKASTFQHSGFFTARLSHPYMTTEKNIALTRWTFVGKVMSLLFNMLSRLVITFLPRSKHLLISWLQAPSIVILEP